MRVQERPVAPPPTAADRLVAARALHDAALADRQTSPQVQLDRRVAETQAALEAAERAVATEAKADRVRRIEDVATNVLPKASLDLAKLIGVATRTRSMADVRACDTKARQVSSLRNLLMELTGDVRRFHPSKSPDLRQLFGKDSELIDLWRRSRNPFEARAPIDPLPGVEVLDGLAPVDVPGV